MRICLRLLSLMSSLWLTACQVQTADSAGATAMPQPLPVEAEQVTAHHPPCRFIRDETLLERFDCDLDYLLQLHAMAMQTSWPLRSAGLPTAAFNDVATTLFAAILVLPADTPYQPRLRAHQQASALSGQLSPATADWLLYMVSQPNQRLLQLESETVMQRREIRSMQQKLLELQQQVGEQERQIQALLQIEASLLNKEGASL